MPPRRPKMHPRRPKIASRWPKTAQEAPKRPPRAPPRRPERAKIIDFPQAFERFLRFYLTAFADRFLVGSKESIRTPQGGLGGSRGASGQAAVEAQIAWDILAKSPGDIRPEPTVGHFVVFEFPGFIAHWTVPPESNTCSSSSRRSRRSRRNDDDEEQEEDSGDADDENDDTDGDDEDE